MIKCCENCGSKCLRISHFATEKKIVISTYLSILYTLHILRFKDDRRVKSGQVRFIYIITLSNALQKASYIRVVVRALTYLQYRKSHCASVFYYYLYYIHTNMHCLGTAKDSTT